MGVSNRLVQIVLSFLAAILFVDSAHGFCIGSRTAAHSCINHRPSAIVSPAASPPDADGLTIIDSQLFYKTRQTRGSSVLHAKKQINGDKDDSKDDDSVMGIFKKSPGTAIVAPFVLLFGFDLIANILVITKRSLEVAFTGEYTVWTPWQ